MLFLYPFYALCEVTVQVRIQIMEPIKKKSKSIFCIFSKNVHHFLIYPAHKVCPKPHDTEKATLKGE